MRRLSHGDAEFALLVDGCEFVLSEPAPDAVGLANGNCVFEARLTNRAFGADGLCPVRTYDSGSTALAFGMEEE